MISDDELLLYYYRDGQDAPERARIGTALAQQPELAQRLHRLVAQLDTVAETPEVPVPPHIEQRWQNALARAASAAQNNYVGAGATTGSRIRTAFRWQTIALAATVAALAVLVTLQVSLQSRDDRPGASNDVPALTTPAAAFETPEAAAYERGLKWHLANTEQRLASLDSAKPEERARLIEAILEQNRMYAVAAERANEPDLARVLRAFTPILETLQAERRDADASDIDQLNFELRVVQARLQATAQPPTKPQSTAL
jgi:hypothetical protein